MAGPLSGVKILDLTTVVMGPFATQILAELGADVIKVEPLEGDNMRHVGPMKTPGMGHLFVNLNRGKRALAVDLKQPEAREVILGLVRDADVLIYNIRPAAMARLGLGYEALRAINPRLVYVGTYGYSERGPNAGRAAYDDLIQGATGLAWLNSREGEAPPGYVPVNMADRLTGLHAVYAVTSALFARERTGEGQSVEVPMFEAVAQFVLGDHLAGLSYVPPISGTGYARLKHRRPYRTRDGWLCVLVYNDRQWRRFLEAVNRQDLVDDPRFASVGGRAAHIDEVYAFLAELLQTRTNAEWTTLLEATDIPVAPMNTVADLVTNEHLTGGGFFEREEHPTEGELRAPRTPTDWSATKPGPRRPAPRLGEHSADILREAGLDDARIADLVQRGIVRTP
ncbi:MAG: CoA transferase [Betaproteobacteria bacterium]|nr:CoA transferase [Betaproteobacteria bacterium]